MKFYFFLLTKEEVQSGTKMGKTYAYNNRSRWIEGPSNVGTFLTVGYVKGVDHVVHDGKAYMMMKSYVDLDDNFVLILCAETGFGCDN